MLDKKLCLCWRLMEASKEVLQKCTEGSNPPVHFDFRRCFAGAGLSKFPLESLWKSAVLMEVRVSWGKGGARL